MPDKDTIKKYWTEGIARRRQSDVEAYKNMAIIQGKHYFHINPQTRKIYLPDPNDNRTRLSIPLIKPIWRTEVAQLTKSRPQPEVIPASNSDSDRQSAKLASLVLGSELQRMDFQEHHARLWSWVCTIGCSYIYVYWDPTTQNIELEVVPKLEVVIDPSVRESSKEAMWIIHGKVLTPEQSFEKFGKDFKPDSQGLPDLWRGLTSTPGGAPNAGKNDGVLVLRMWHRPSTKYPQGMVVTIVGEEVVEEMPFPYAHGEIPFVDFHHVRLPGQYEGQSIIKDLWSSQKDYNAARSRMSETRALLAAPKISAPEGSVDDDRIGTDPGEIFKWRAVGPYKPEPMNPPNIPSFIFKTTEDAMQELMDISGIHEVSKGMSPGAGTAAAAIASLREADSTKLGPIVAGLERSVARVGKQVLGLVQQFWETPRLIRTWDGSSSNFTVETFKGADIPSAVDVRVVAGSALPRSPEQDRQSLLELWDRRVITDPLAILDRMDIPNIGELRDIVNVDISQARREQKKFEEGDPRLFPPAEEWHAHDIHIKEHDDWRKTEAFGMLPDEVRMAVAEHRTQHQQFIQEAQARQMQEQLQQMQQQIAMQPPPPPKSPIESLNYKDAPEDIQRQMEEQAGFEPSATGLTTDQLIEVQKIAAQTGSHEIDAQLKHVAQEQANAHHQEKLAAQAQETFVTQKQEADKLRAQQQPTRGD